MRISDWSSDVCSSDLQEQQENARYEGREPSLAARLYVDDRLADHGAAAHAAKEAGEEVGYALALHLLLLVRTCIGKVVYDLRGQHGFEQADCCHRRRVGQDRSEEHTSELQSLMRISYAVFCSEKKH